MNFFFQTENGEIINQLPFPLPTSINEKNWMRMIGGIMQWLYLTLKQRKNAGLRSFFKPSLPIYINFQIGEVNYNTIIEDAKEHAKFKVGSESQRKTFENILWRLIGFRFFTQGVQFEEIDVRESIKQHEKVIKDQREEQKRLAEERRELLSHNVLAFLENNQVLALNESNEVNESEFSTNGIHETISA